MSDTTENAVLRVPVPTAGTRLSGARLKQAALGLALAVGIFAAADYGDYYWTTSRYLILTDDAYVDVHSAIIAPKVSGYISDVPVNDNQPVKPGEVIARIDPRDYQTALAQARGNVDAAQASIVSLGRQIEQQKLVVDQNQQQVVSDQAALTFAQAEPGSLHRACADRLRHRPGGAAMDLQPAPATGRIAARQRRGRCRAAADPHPRSATRAGESRAGAAAGGRKAG